MAAPPVPVVYVVGSSHSGSTLLALLGSQHPQVASVGEASVKPSIRRAGRAPTQLCSCGEQLQCCPFWGAIFAEVTSSGQRLDASHWSNDYRFEHPWLDRIFTRETSAVSVRRLRRWAARHLPGYRRRVARIDAVNIAFIAAVLHQTGARVFLDTTKLPTRLTHLLDVPALDVRVAWLTRDARGVAHSAKKRGLSIEDATEVWRHDQASTRRLLDRLPEARRFHLRYEDLCAAPAESLARFWTFCGVPPIEVEGTMRPRDRHVLGNSMRNTDEIRVRLDEGWRAGLTEQEQRRVIDLAGPDQDALGYR